MKRATWFLFGLALILAAPVFSQGDADDKKMKERIEALEELVETQGKTIKTLDGYVRSVKAQGVALTAALKKAEKDGFLFPAPNTSAKKALLKGLQGMATTLSSGTAAK